MARDMKKRNWGSGQVHRTNRVKGQAARGRGVPDAPINPMPVPTQSDHNQLSPVDMVQRGTHGPYRGNAEFEDSPEPVRKTARRSRRGQ